MKDLGPITWLWNFLPWYVQVGAIGYVAFSSLGGTIGFYRWTKSWAGNWAIPAMASLAIPAAFWVYTLLKGKEPSPNEHADDEDPPLRKVPKPKRTSGVRTKRPNLLDTLRGLGKR